MTLDPGDFDATDEQLRQLFERDRTEELGDGDVALVRSITQHIRDPDRINSLLAEGFECQPFVEAAAELVRDDPPVWPLPTLRRLSEALLFHGLDRQAATIADELRRREPGDAYAIRLWALSAGEPEATMRRFVAALPAAREPAAVIADAREFASRNLSSDLMPIIEEAVTRLDGKTRG